jgi:hypothetical protein
MKKTLISAVFTLTAIASFAQTNSESSHLVFKGVPIDGNLKEYTLNMEKSGFTHIKTEDGISLLKGDFAGYKGCLVGVATQKQKDLVSKINVFFPEQETWSTLSDTYFSLKEMLTEKYGKPSEVKEKFDVNYGPIDDDSRMHEVKMDNCKYYTNYTTEKGKIQLMINHDGVMSCFVQLTYFDKINGEKIREKAIDDL